MDESGALLATWAEGVGWGGFGVRTSSKQVQARDWQGLTGGVGPRAGASGLPGCPLPAAVSCSSGSHLPRRQGLLFH